MSWLAKAAYIVGTVLFVVLLKGGHFGLASALIGFGIGAGLLAIWRYLRAAREREARQWQMDMTIPMKLRRPKDGRRKSVR